MKIKVIDNISERLLTRLLPKMENANNILFAVAFARLSGFKFISKQLLQCLDDGGRIEFLLGLDFRTTEPDVLEIIQNHKSNGKNINLYCFRDISSGETAIYHPKLYFFDYGTNISISIGSSNLTAGGLKDNIEINTVIEASSSEEIVSDVHEIYNRLKFHKSRFEPDKEYIDEYRRAYEITKEQTEATAKNKNIQKIIRDLSEKEKTLPSPKPSKKDLTGWQKIVFDRVPDEAFQTQDMYSYQDEFREIYPENKHVPDKIRQVIQQLRDLGFLEDRGRGWWKKVGPSNQRKEKK
jgi:HKD family nuclease